MARISGVSNSFRSVGLGSILQREHHKILPGASRANVLLGLAAAAPRRPALSKSPAISLASSPIDSGTGSYNLAATDHPHEFIEEDIWAFDGWTPNTANCEPLSSSSIAEAAFVDAGSLARQPAATPSTSAHHQASASTLLPPMLTSSSPHQGSVKLTSALTSNLTSVLTSSEQAHQRYPVVPSQRIPQVEKDSSDDHIMMYARHQSAPVNVPDWSKILKRDQNGAGKTDGIFENDDEDVDFDEERMPPHELIAKERAQSQMITFSVYEGQGRTLKGRDMSRVRNAIWRQIGFAD